MLCGVQGKAQKATRIALGAKKFPDEIGIHRSGLVSESKPYASCAWINLLITDQWLFRPLPFTLSS